MLAILYVQGAMCKHMDINGSVYMSVHMYTAAVKAQFSSVLHCIDNLLVMNFVNGPDHEKSTQIS